MVSTGQNIPSTPRRISHAPVFHTDDKFSIQDVDAASGVDALRLLVQDSCTVYDMSACVEKGIELRA